MAYAFDEEKLRQLIIAKDRAHAVRRSISDRYQDAREQVARLEGLLHHQTHAGGVARDPDENQLARIKAAKANRDQIQQELDEYNESVRSLMVTATRCEEWAKEQGWRPDQFAPPGIPVPPQITNAAKV